MKGVVSGDPKWRVNIRAGATKMAPGGAQSTPPLCKQHGASLPVAPHRTMTLRLDSPPAASTRHASPTNELIPSRTEEKRSRSNAASRHPMARRLAPGG